MIDQTNPYETSETLDSRDMTTSEAKTPVIQWGIWFWLLMGCLVPLALIGLLGIAIMVYVILYGFM